MSVVFLHLPKTGGLALTTALQSHFGADKTLLVPAGGGVTPGQEEFIAGHFGYGFAQGRYITVLRDPIERTISHYAQHLRNDEHPREVTLEQWLLACPRQWSNLQTRWLSTPGSCYREMALSVPEGTGFVEIVGDIAQARENLATFAAVGVYEVPSTFQHIAQACGLERLDMPRINEGPRPKRHEVRPETLERIAQGNQFDLDLWGEYWTKAMRCRVCGEQTCYPLWNDGLGMWARCSACGSDSSSHTWEGVRPSYNGDYLKNHAHATPDEILVDMRANLDWFVDHSGRAPSKDFLDIGCAEGSALRGMAQRGWSVGGFDLIPEAKLASPPGDHITIAETFRANLFPRRYGAIMAREVIEHVPNWRAFLDEIHAAALPGALVQIQTPRPTAAWNRIGYQSPHLQLFAPYTLRYWSERLGFDVIDYRLHEQGQAWMLRRVGS